GRAARSAVGLVSNRDLVLVSTHTRLTTTEMGKVMARLGIRDALLLDGGSSAGIAWNGSPVLESVRKVSYGIGVFTDYTGRRYLR
uniref:phosphodiester glycosidase family protein n=1 Tax=Deinococcus sp. TaxID=47478 RepID=UPI002869AD11